MFFFGSICMAQITIDFPKERQIFQRQKFYLNSNFLGDGIIRISGNFTVEYDSILAKVEPRIVGQGTASGWKKSIHGMENLTSKVL